MPGSVSLTGADTILVNGRVFNDLADGDSVMISFPNDLAVVKASKNGNSIFAKDEKGRQAEVTIRVLLGSADDKFLTSLLQSMNADFSAFALMSAMFSKRVGDGASVISTKVYSGTGGVFKKQPEAKTSSEGDTEQSVAAWVISFANMTEVIQ